MRGCTAVWRLDIAKTRSLLETIDFELDLLSQPECSIPEQDRLTTRRALRVLLHHYNGPDTARAVMKMTETGRPVLDSSDAPQFSISHSAGIALIALSEAAPLGIDIEMQHPLKMSLERRTRLAIGARAAGLRVPAALCEATDLSDQSDRDVLVVWTQLEALAKARGEGIGTVLQAIGMRRERAPGQDAVTRNLIPPECDITELDLEQGLYAAVVHPRTHAPGRVCPFPVSARRDPRNVPAPIPVSIKVDPKPATRHKARLVRSVAQPG